jgi:hypothetical protein
VAPAASVATEQLATLPGYEVSMLLLPLAGDAILTRVTVPTSKIEFYWVGAFDSMSLLLPSMID